MQYLISAVPDQCSTRLVKYPISAVTDQCSTHQCSTRSVQYSSVQYPISAVLDQCSTHQCSTRSVQYPISAVPISAVLDQCSTRSVQYPISAVPDQCSTRSVQYPISAVPISAVLDQCSTRLMQYSISAVPDQCSTHQCSTRSSRQIVMKIEHYRQIFEKYSNIKFHKNPSFTFTYVNLTCRCIRILLEFHSESTRFECQPENRLSWLRYFAILLRLLRRMPGKYFNCATKISFKIFFISSRSAAARHHPHHKHDLLSGSQDHHPSKNSVQKTICCNSKSDAPDDGRMYSEHVELRIH